MDTFDPYPENSLTTVYDRLYLAHGGQMKDLDRICDPTADADCKQIVGQILTLLENKPLEYAKGVLRMASYGVEARSVVTPSE